MEQNKPEYIIVHHTGGTNANPLADTSHHTAEMVDAYHKSLGWDGIGYNYFIEKDGTIKPGRPENVKGAHTIGYNDKSIGICLAGNFDVTLPTVMQEKSLGELIRTMQKRYKIPIEKVVPHRTFAQKSCYGKMLANNWAQMVASKDYDKSLALELVNDIEDLLDKLKKIYA